jgi:hypothetical protein
MKIGKSSQLGSALLLSLSTLIPLATQHVGAQSSGTNGQLFFNYSASSSSAYSIAAVNSDGAESHLITGASSDVSDVSFLYDVSSDGSKVLYMRKPDANSNYSLIVANANGSSPVTLLTGATNLGASYAAFSPDGATVFFEEQGSSATPGILSVAVTGGSPSVVVSPGANENFGRIITSGANSKMYYQDFIGGSSPSYGIKSAGLDGSGAATVYSGFAVPQDTSPDGSKLLMLEKVSNKYVLSTVNASDGSGKTVVVNPSPNEVLSASYSPDATKVAYINSSTGGNIVNADGSGTPSVFRADALGTVIWSKVANATTGTYTTPLATGVLASSQGGGTGGGSGGDAAPGTVVTVSDDQSSTGQFVSTNETLIVDGKVGATVVNTGGVLKGTGAIVGDLTVNTGGIVAPGHSPGCLTMNNLSLAGTYQAEIGGTDPCSGYDQLKVTGTVNLTNSTLESTLYNYFVPKVGQSYTIIDNDGTADAVTSTFNGIAEGGEYTNQGVTYTVTYVGGDGNDVVITVKAVDASKLPKNPNTGFQLVSANAATTLGITTLLAGALFVLARRFNSAK